MGYQFKPYLAGLILDLIKTQTRRPFKPGDRYSAILQGVLRMTKSNQERLQWKVGNRYAIQPGRGKKAVGYLELTNIRFEDVREISLEDAIAEGFETPLDFLAVWVGFYDPLVHLEKLDGGRWHFWINTPSRTVRTSAMKMRVGNVSIEVTASADQILDLLKRHRPDNLYKAWAHTFKLVAPVADAVVQL
jgi:hypothetical protein